MAYRLDGLDQTCLCKGIFVSNQIHLISMQAIVPDLQHVLQVPHHSQDLVVWQRSWKLVIAWESVNQ